MMIELWLVRHGQTDWNLTGRWQGQADDAPGLNDIGREQVMAIRKQLKSMHFAAIYSSDLLRARQTASLIAESIKQVIVFDPRLREINLGVWEGMASEEIEKQYPRELAERAQNPFHTRAPDGESPRDVADCILAAINEIAGVHRDCEGAILIVSHGLSLAVIICLCNGFPMKDVYQHIPDNAQPYIVQWKQ